MLQCMMCYQLSCVVDRNALNIVKDDLIARVDELTRSVINI